MFFHQVLVAKNNNATPEESPSVWQRFNFQRKLIGATFGLSVSIFKLTEDVKSVIKYTETSDYYFISLMCLIVPPLFYSLYLMGQNWMKNEVIEKNELVTRAVNGAFLYPWQIKSRIEVMHFTVQRVCQFRPPNRLEKQDLKIMEWNAQVLEFFQKMYSGIFQTLLQVYLIVLSFMTLSGASGDESAKYTLSQLLASLLSVRSMLVAVRRKDDGWMTRCFSSVGWLSLILSRVLVISLAATIMHGKIVLLALVHILAFSIWIYLIAIKSHLKNTISESAENMDQWATTRKRVTTGLMVILFFGIPSLFIWPMMFQLREKSRSIKFLLVIVIENALLLTIWFLCKGYKTFSSIETWETLIVVIIFFTTFFGTLFLLLYVLSKPEFTDLVVLADIRESRAKQSPNLDGANSHSLETLQYGIYYEFCDLVFNLPSTDQMASGLKEIRTLADPAVSDSLSE